MNRRRQQVLDLTVELRRLATAADPGKPRWQLLDAANHVPGWFLAPVGSGVGRQRRYAIARPVDRGPVAWAVPGGLPQYDGPQTLFVLRDEWLPDARAWLGGAS